jgi:type I R/M system specificity subunit
MNTNNVNSPKRRFRSFEGEWEQRKLGNIASMHARIGWQNLRTSEFLDNGDYYLITGTDFLNGRINFEKCHYVNKERYQQDKKIQVGKGSILITKDGTLGKVALVTDLNKPATLNAGVFNVVVKVPSINETYLYQYLAAPFLMDYVSKRATGGTIKHLNQGILVDFPVDIPSYKEQVTIGQFLVCLDNAVTLHQHKLDKLKNLKKAYLSEMFPTEGERVPKRRFPGFEGKWECRKLKKLAEFRRGSFPQPYGKTEWYGGSGSMPFVQVVDVLSNLKLAETTKQQISRLAQNQSVLVPKDSVVVTLQGSIGRVAITQYDAYVDRTLLIFEKFLLPIDGYYWALSIQKLFDIESKKAPGGTIKTITKEALSEFEVLVPVIDEQKKIGNFFKKLDQSITLQQQKLDKLNDLKKAYLNELFV